MQETKKSTASLRDVFCNASLLCSASASWQVGKTLLQIRARCNVLLHSTNCSLVTMELTVLMSVQSGYPSEKRCCFGWNKVPGNVQNDFLRTFLPLAAGIFSCFSICSTQCQILGWKSNRESLASAWEVLLSGVTFNPLGRVSGYLADLPETFFLIMLFKHSCEGQRALHFQNGICVCMHIFFSLIITPIENV